MSRKVLINYKFHLLNSHRTKLTVKIFILAVLPIMHWDGLKSTSKFREDQDQPSLFHLHLVVH